MDDGEFERMPNPFSPFAENRDSGRKNLVRAAGLLVVAAVSLLVLTAAQGYLSRARISGLAHRFAQGSPEDKLQQLQQFRQAGLEGIPPLVAALADEEAAVAEAAAESLEDLRLQWLALPRERRLARHRVFAAALQELTPQLRGPDDPIGQRLMSLADRAAREWASHLESGGRDPAAEAVYRQLIDVIAQMPGNTLPENHTAGNHSPAAPDEGAAGLAAAHPDPTDAPLPIGAADAQAARWTDWPPASTAPQLYRRSVAALPVDATDSAALMQVADAPEGEPARAASVSNAEPQEPVIVKPRFRPAATLAEQRASQALGENATTEYWISQLRSPSRWVRMRAVAELGERGDRPSLDALRDWLAEETDQTVAFRIRQRLQQ